MAPQPTRILLFSLDDLRDRYGSLGRGPSDPRSDTSPFRMFRTALLAQAARAADGRCVLTMWWEGTYNGYALAVAIEPAAPLAAIDTRPACPVEGERIAPPRPDRYPLAHVEPGRAEVARDPEGGTWEAPFGQATGHFGAPGMRNIR
ncbi:MAG TPA: hypothetical protein VFK90_02905 [Anaeromyxobacter sp.]|nr:hypothetical protein [Anaeromyxobacter sp.]